MTTPTTTRTGFPAMEKAEPTFLSGHIPPWARKPLRAYMRRTVGPPVWQGDEHHCRLFQDLRLFDHWGSVERDGIRHLISQPYTPEHALRPLAEAFAQAIGCRVIACRPGAPWAPGALWVEFGPTISAFPSATATRPPS